MRRVIVTCVSVLAIVVVGPPLVIAAWPDARLVPGARAWLDARPPAVPVADNLFDGLVGFPLPGDDFVAAGARLVAAANRARGHPAAGADPFAGWREGRLVDPALGRLCRPGAEGCAARWRSIADAIEAVAARHRALLARLDRLEGLRGYSMTLEPTPGTPRPPVANLLAIHRLRLDELGVRCASGSPWTVYAALGRDIDFDRRLMRETQWLLTKIVAVSLLREALYTYAECLDLHPADAASLADTAPLAPAERSLRGPMRTEFRLQAALLDEATGHPDRLAATLGVPRWVLVTLLAPRRTENLVFRSYATAADISEMPAGQVARAAPRRLAALAPGLGDYLLNPVGAALFGVGMPSDVAYVYRVHDVDGLIGLVDAKRALYALRVPPDGIAAALTDQSRVRWRSPYDGSPFRWDASAHEIRFTSPDVHSRANRLPHPG